MKVNCLFSPKDEYKKIVEIHIENHGIKYIINLYFLINLTVFCELSEEIDSV